MTRIKLVNEAGTLVGRDIETGETVPLEFGETVVESLSVANSHPARSMQVRNAARFPGATGGEQIEAALADLPTRGGLVFIPAEGPDTVDGETAVWEVESTIFVNQGKYLVGAGPGWRIGGTGTTLRGTDATTMVQLGGQFLNGIFDLRLDGNDTATVCLDMGRGLDENDYVARNVVFHGALEYGIRLRGRRNFWIDQCWIEECGVEFGHGGIATHGSIVRDTIWMTDLLMFNNAHDIVFRHGDTTTVQKVWITNLRSDTSEHHSIAQQVSAPIRDVWIARPHITAAGVSAEGEWDAMNFAAGAEALSIADPTIRGNGITRNAIHRELGGWTDCSVHNVTATGITGERLAGVTGEANGTRTLVNRLGYNGEDDPSTGGDWNGHEWEGVRVVWTNEGTEMLAECIAGEWFSREL